MTVKELISDESKWVQSNYALDKDGLSCDELSENAVCFCLSGALNRVYAGTIGYQIARDKISYAIAKHTGNRQYTIVGFNDDKNTTFKDIKAVLELAGV